MLKVTTSLDQPLLPHSNPVDSKRATEAVQDTLSHVNVDSQEKKPIKCHPNIHKTLVFSSLPVKFVLSFASNYYVLSAINRIIESPNLSDEEIQIMVIALSLTKALASMINRLRNQMLWNRDMFPKHSNAQSTHSLHKSRFYICFTRSNQFLQMVNNWGINLIINTIQIFHALKILPIVPQNTLCLSPCFAFALPLSFLVALQYKTNKIDKQQTQLKSFFKSLKVLVNRKSIPKLLLITFLTVATIASFSMTSFFVLKSSTTDFLNYLITVINAILKYLNVDFVVPLIRNNTTLTAINGTVSAIAIISGLIQSICTSAIIFKIFNWNSDIKPHLGYYYKHKKCIFVLGLSVNFIYMAINALITYISSHYVLSKFATPDQLFHMNYVVDSNCSAPLPLANHSSLGNHTSDSSHDSADSIMLYMLQYVLPGLFAGFQALPIFFNNMLYNFFPDIAKAKKAHQRIQEENNDLTQTSLSRYSPHFTDRNTKLKTTIQLPEQKYGKPCKIYKDTKGVKWYVYRLQDIKQKYSQRFIDKEGNQLIEVVSENSSHQRQPAHTKSNARCSFWRQCCCMFGSNRYNRDADDEPVRPPRGQAASPRSIG